MVGRIITDEDDLAEGVAWICAAEPRFAAAHAITGPLPLRRRAGGFPALLDAIVSQQVSVASADGVWRRLEAAGGVSPEGVRALGEDGLRACGLSRQKISYARGLAEAELDFAALEALPDADVVAALVALKGIGRWSAEIYAMFSLGRADVFAAGDLAMQEAARVLFDLPARPGEAALRGMAEAWSPWRAVAARQLWAYYMIAKKRDGVR